MLDPGRPLAVGLPFGVELRAIGRLLTAGLLVTLSIALYDVWTRRDEWTRNQKLYKTFALVASGSVVLAFGDTVGIRLPRPVEIAVLAVGFVSVTLWAWFGAAVRRDRPG